MESLFLVILPTCQGQVLHDLDPKTLPWLLGDILRGVWILEFLKHRCSKARI